MSSAVTIVGAGPVGTLLALLLARRGRRVSLFERRADPRRMAAEGGRSINLALATRGLRALQAADVLARLQPLMTEMRGRMLHDDSGHRKLLPYGQRPDEVIWSISRMALNRELIIAAGMQPGITLHFEHRCTDVDPLSGDLEFQGADGRLTRHSAELVIAADGAGSAVRTAMVARQLCQASEDWLAHDYKELVIAAGPDRSPQLERHALHIWPRGGHMLIALPNADGSFTATLFLPRQGPSGFESLTDSTALQRFFAQQFPDALPLLPDLATQFAAHPQSPLATLHCWPWHAGRALLIGDAAHAIVPFHGQGLNCGFEDCLLLDALLARGADVPHTLADFERERRPDTDAIAIMALENYQEMRDTVRAPHFEQRKRLANELERLHPTRFIPRYSMVMFHPEIPYAEALQRGITQERLLDALLARGLPADSVEAGELLQEAGL